ncbi:MAG: class I SAM-dependent methyltransferase [Paracoccaceae bacterium]
MIADLHYTAPRLARLYDQTCGFGPDTAFYLALAGPAPLRILDLGCGTGTLCHAYAALGHHVTGADPSPAMLDVARSKPNASHITWLAATAETFRSPDMFDLIVMTGHAFQQLRTEADITSALSVMRRHLASDGRIAFETRNPAIKWAKRWHGLTQTHQCDGQTVQQTHSVTTTGPAHVTFDTTYTFGDATLTSTTTLHFPSHATLLALIARAGLHPMACFGDWQNAPFDAATSDEMIFVISQSVMPD